MVSRQRDSIYRKDKGLSKMLRRNRLGHEEAAQISPQGRVGDGKTSKIFRGKKKRLKPGGFCVSMLSGKQIWQKWCAAPWGSIHPHNGILLSEKNEQMTNTRNNISKFKCIMLNERSQYQKVTYYMIPFIGHSGKGKSVGGENRWVVSRVVSGERVQLKRGSRRKFFGVFQLSYILAVMLVIRIYACVKIYRLVPPNVNFTLCNF